MAARDKNEGLSIGYRLAYRLKQFGLSIFGPAQLGGAGDPKVRLKQERAAKVAAAKAARERRSAG